MAEAIPNSQAMRDNPSRTLGLEFVKRFIVEELSPLGIGEKDSIRLFFAVACKEDFPSKSLYRKAVKHKLVELYNTAVCVSAKIWTPTWLPTAE